jgi:CPA1 family monovalent cation:H+ antiporter
VVLQFIRVVGIGIGVRFALGLVISTIIQRIDEPMLEITLTTIAAYGAFAAAEQIHGSGVIATVVAGMVCGNYGAQTGMSPTTRVAVELFWEYIAFALNSIIFLLIGFEVQIADLLSYWPLILSAFLAVTVGRTAVVFVLAPVAARGVNRIPATWRAILSWGGLRGGLSMVLALSLPLDFPNRALLIATTFGVVILSILVQGLTMAPLLRGLGVASSHAERVDYDRNRSELMAVQAALRELDRMAQGGHGDPSGLAALRSEYEARRTGVEGELDRMRETHADLHAAEQLRARRHLLMVEKAEAIEANHQGAAEP